MLRLSFSLTVLISLESTLPESTSLALTLPERTFQEPIFQGRTSSCPFFAWLISVRPICQSMRDEEEARCGWKI